MKRKILFFIKSLGVGGAERHVFQLAISFKERGDEVFVVHLDDHNSFFHEKLVQSGIKIQALDIHTSKLRAFTAFNLLVREFEPDIVHSHLPVSNIFARIGRLFFKYYLVSTYHNELTRLRYISRLAEIFSFWLSHKNISCSTAVAASIPWHSVVIDNGIDTSSYKVTRQSFIRQHFSIAEDAKVFLNIANFWAKKNQHLLIEAFADFIYTCAESAHLVILGASGDQETSLHQLRERLGLEGNIHFLYMQNNVSDVLSDADVFCMTSDFEGLPLALLEAMTFSLPCIVTDAGGMSEAVVDGLNGFVCPKGDKACISKAMNRLYFDSSLCTSMGRKGLERVRKQYAQEKMVSLTEKVYNQR